MGSFIANSLFVLLLAGCLSLPAYSQHLEMPCMLSFTSCCSLFYPGLQSAFTAYMLLATQIAYSGSTLSHNQAGSTILYPASLQDRISEGQSRPPLFKGSETIQGSMECDDTGCSNLVVSESAKLKLRSGSSVTVSVSPSSVALKPFELTITVKSSVTKIPLSQDYVTPSFSILHKLEEGGVLTPKSDAEKPLESMEMNGQPSGIKIKESTNNVPFWSESIIVKDLPSKMACGKWTAPDLTLRQNYAVTPNVDQGWIVFQAGEPYLEVELCVVTPLSSKCEVMKVRAGEEFEPPVIDGVKILFPSFSTPMSPPKVSMATSYTVSGSRILTGMWRFGSFPGKGSMISNGFGAVQTACVPTKANACKVNSFDMRPYIKWNLQEKQMKSNAAKPLIETDDFYCFDMDFTVLCYRKDRTKLDEIIQASQSVHGTAIAQSQSEVGHSVVVTLLVVGIMALIGGSIVAGLHLATKDKECSVPIVQSSHANLEAGFRNFDPLTTWVSSGSLLAPTDMGIDDQGIITGAYEVAIDSYEPQELTLALSGDDVRFEFSGLGEIKKFSVEECIWRHGSYISACTALIEYIGVNFDCSITSKTEGIGVIDEMITLSSSKKEFRISVVTPDVYSSKPEFCVGAGKSYSCAVTKVTKDERPEISFPGLDDGKSNEIKAKNNIGDFNTRLFANGWFAALMIVLWIVGAIVAIMFVGVVITLMARCCRGTRGLTSWMCLLCLVTVCSASVIENAEDVIDDVVKTADEDVGKPVKPQPLIRHMEPRLMYLKGSQGKTVTSLLNEYAKNQGRIPDVSSLKLRVQTNCSLGSEIKSTWLSGSDYGILIPTAIQGVDNYMWMDVRHYAQSTLSQCISTRFVQTGVDFCGLKAKSADEEFVPAIMGGSVTATTVVCMVPISETVWDRATEISGSGLEPMDEAIAVRTDEAVTDGVYKHIGLAVTQGDDSFSILITWFVKSDMIRYEALLTGEFMLQFSFEMLTSSFSQKSNFRLPFYTIAYSWEPIKEAAMVKVVNQMYGWEGSKDLVCYGSKVNATVACLAWSNNARVSFGERFINLHSGAKPEFNEHCSTKDGMVGIPAFGGPHEALCFQMDGGLAICVSQDMVAVIRGDVSGSQTIQVRGVDMKIPASMRGLSCRLGTVGTIIHSPTSGLKVSGGSAMVKGGHDWKHFSIMKDGQHISETGVVDVFTDKLQSFPLKSPDAGSFKNSSTFNGAVNSFRERYEPIFLATCITPAVMILVVITLSCCGKVKGVPRTLMRGPVKVYNYGRNLFRERDELDVLEDAPEFRAPVKRFGTVRFRR